MRFSVVFFAVFAAQASLTAAATWGRRPQAEPASASVLENRNLRSLTSPLTFSGRLKRLSRRSPQISVGVALLGGIYDTVGNYFTKYPESTVPDVREEPSPLFKGAKRKTIRYGPYRIPPTSEANVQSVLLGMGGMTDVFAAPAKKPCDGECLLLGIFASLEYADGRIAEPKNGAWLHHAVLFTNGPGVEEVVCGGKEPWEPIFETGNERTQVLWGLPNSTVSAGYHLRPNNNLTLNAELMNMEDNEKFGWVTLTFDYREEKEVYDKAMEGKVVWMSIGPNRCENGEKINPFGESNITVSQQPTQMVFSENSFPWTAPYDGLILGANGHMHDGGTDIEVFLNNKVICLSKPTYAKSEFPMQHGHNPTPKQSGTHSHSGKRRRSQLPPLKAPNNSNNMDIEHIAGQEACMYFPPIPVKKGDVMHIRTNYDFNLHPGMVNANGEVDEVMGIVGVLVAFRHPLR